jgi:hypothetical protein
LQAGTKNVRLGIRHGMAGASRRQWWPEGAWGGARREWLGDQSYRWEVHEKGPTCFTSAWPRAQPVDLSSRVPE